MKLKKIYWDKTDPDKLTTVFMGLTLAVYKNNDKWEARLASPQQRPDGKIGKNPETYQAPELEPFLTRNKGDQNES